MNIEKEIELVMQDGYQHWMKLTRKRNKSKEYLLGLGQIYSACVLKKGFLDLRDIFPSLRSSIFRNRKRKDGSWKYIPYYNIPFTTLVGKIIEKYKVKSFLDVGCGLGDKVLLAKSMGLNSCGIEYDKNYVEKAVSLGVNAILCDAFLFDKYNQYDLIYMYHPIADESKYKKLVEVCLRGMKKGALFVEVYQIYLVKDVFYNLFEQLGLEIIGDSEDKIIIRKK